MRQQNTLVTSERLCWLFQVKSRPCPPIGCIRLLLVWLVRWVVSESEAMPGGAPFSPGVLFFLTYCWIWFANTLPRAFELKRYWPVILFPWNALSLVLCVCRSHRMSWEIFPHPPFSEWNFFFHHSTSSGFYSFSLLSGSLYLKHICCKT